MNLFIYYDYLVVTSLGAAVDSCWRGVNSRECRRKKHEKREMFLVFLVCKITRCCHRSRTQALTESALTLARYEVDELLVSDPEYVCLFSSRTLAIFMNLY